MPSRFTILTHFSQRYSKLAQLDEFLPLSPSPVCSAFDGMSVSPRSMRGTGEAMNELLERAFAPEVAYMEKVGGGGGTCKENSEIV